MIKQHLYRSMRPILGGMLIAVWMLFSAFAHAASPTVVDSSVKGDVFSRSPLGYAAFLRYLENSHDKVQVVPTPLSLDFDAEDVVLLLDPTLSYPLNSIDASSLQAYLDSPATLIVAAPKRIALLRDITGDRLLSSGVIREGDAAAAVRMLGLDTRIHRLEAQDLQHQWPLVPDVGRAQVFADWPKENTTRLLGDEIYAFVLSTTRPNGAQTFFVSDAEIFSNHSFAMGDNAQLVDAILGLAQAGKGAIYLDASFHGYAHSFSILSTAYSFPGALLTFSFFLLLAFILWRRLATRAMTVDSEVVVLDPKTVLAQSTGRLLAESLTPKENLQHYRDVLVSAAMEQSGTLRRLPPEEHIEKLEAVRGPTRALTDLDAQLNSLSPHVKGPQTRALAQLYQQWFTEVTDGTI